MNTLKIRCITNRLISRNTLGLLVVSQLLINLSVAQTPEPVVWVDLENATVQSDNSLLRISDGPYGTTGAASEQVISGDGNIYFDLPDPGPDQEHHYVIGLATGNPDANYPSIDYGVVLYGVNDTFLVFEKNVTKYSSSRDPSFFVPGKRFTIERQGATISYYHDDTLIYTSQTSSTGDLLLDVAMGPQGDVIPNVMITEVEGPQPPADAQVFDTDVIIGDTGQSANLEVYGTSSLGPVNLDVTGGNLGPADNVDYEMAPFLLKHNGFNFGIDGDQLSTDAAPFIIQNSNTDGDIIFRTGAINIDRLVIDSDGNVKVPSPAGDIPTITYE